MPGIRDVFLVQKNWTMHFVQKWEQEISYSDSDSFHQIFTTFWPVMMWVFFSLHYQQERVLYNSSVNTKCFKGMQEKWLFKIKYSQNTVAFTKKKILNNVSVVFLFAADFINWTFYSTSSSPFLWILHSLLFIKACNWGSWALLWVEYNAHDVASSMFCRFQLIPAPLIYLAGYRLRLH